MADSKKEQFKKGDFIGKDYEVFDVLGEGGFGMNHAIKSQNPKPSQTLNSVNMINLDAFSSE